ncbi:MAG: amino acid racemase [Bacillota bacterium]|nr:amino acid racemase [Bacillota bacterium]
MKTLGIIGGMGPLAGADLVRKIVLLTDASMDQEHIHVLLDSNPAIPDRTRAIVHGGPSPLPELRQSARRLVRAGADAIVMACNTAHFYHEPLQASIKVPVLHMLRETALEVQRLGAEKVGLLATDGTVSTGIYPEIFSELGIEMIAPTPAGQRELMTLIYDDIKSGSFSMDTEILLQEFQALRRRGAELLILGCTELSVAFEHYGWDIPAVDPMTVLAKTVIRRAGKRVKSGLPGSK